MCSLRLLLLPQGRLNPWHALNLTWNLIYNRSGVHFCPTALKTITYTLQLSLCTKRFSVFMLMQLVSKTNQTSAFGSITLHLIKLKMIKNDQLVGSLLKCYHGTCPTLLHLKTFTPLYSGMILWLIQIVVLLSSFWWDWIALYWRI